MSNATNQTASIETKKDYKNTPAGQYKYYAEELGSSLKMLAKWQKSADKINKKFLGKSLGGREDEHQTSFKLNMFNSNVTTLKSMLYGQTPTIDVSRRFADQNDDVARVAGEVMDRMLNLDVQQNGEEVDSILQSALSDRLIVGLGCARVRYDVQTADIDGKEQMISESAPTEYYHWGDVLWGWARNWSEIPWLSYRSYLTKDEAATRFGEKVAEKLKYQQQKPSTSDETAEDPDTGSAWQKAEIWEIWDKTERKVVWLCIGYDKVLDTKKDPLKLQNFFPSPPFLLANPTTSLYIPTPDYELAQDLYNEIDKLQERISIITEAVKVVGVYDASNTDIQNMFQAGTDNKLIPVDNWALFAEKQGLRGQIDWLPLQDIVGALDKLRELRSDAIGLLQQVTGMSDIMRGELGSAYEGVGQSEMKAKFGSVRVQALQDQFAKFATDLFQIKAEIIAKHFSPQTIAQKSNMQTSVDVDKLPAAIALIKKYDESQLRVAIRPESVAMVDYAQLKSERTEYINSLAIFMQSAAPLMEQDPATKPFLLQLLQWGLAGFKGASEIEGVIDDAIEATQQAEKEQQGEEQPDPAQVAAQMAMQAEEQKHQGEMQKIQAKAEADMQLRQQDFELDVATAREAHNMKMEEVAADMQRALAETQAKMQADILVEQVQAETNMQQTQRTVEGEMMKDTHEAQLDVAKEANKTSNKIKEIRTSAIAKISESQVKAKEQTSAKPTSTGGGTDE